MTAALEGNLRKMRTELVDGEARYTLLAGEHEIALNALVGSVLTLQFRNEINCINCGRKTKKASTRVTASLAFASWPAVIAA